MNSTPSPVTDRTARRRLGRSDVEVTTLGLGGAGIGNLYRAIDDAEAIGTVRCALELGVGLVDTAPFYGFGLSERRVGRALKQSGLPRPCISTKVGRVLDSITSADIHRERHSFYSAEPYEPRFDYSYDGVLRSYESSLERLGLSRIDVLLCHDIGVLTHGDMHRLRLREFIEGGYRAMRRLRDEGAVGAIGLGVNECEVCVKVLEDCDLDCLLLAGRYTLLDQQALASLFPLCERREVSILIGGPFNSGILAADATHYASGRFDYRPAAPEIIEKVRRMSRVCADFDVALPAAALQFPLAHPQVAAVLPGCSSIDEIRRTAALFAQTIPADLWSALREERLLDSQAPVAL